MVISCLVVMAVSFIAAFAYEATGPNSPVWALGFFFCYFLMPLVGFFSLLREGRIHTKSESRPSRIFEGAIIVAFVPCLLGLLLTINIGSLIIADPHGLSRGNWAHMY